MKRLACIFTFAGLLAASCGGQQVPPELVFKKTTDFFEVYYPKGFVVKPSVGGGVNIASEDNALQIPFAVYPFEEAKPDDISSIQELVDAFGSKNNSPGNKASVKGVSGHDALWIEGEANGETIYSFFLPLNGVVINCMMFPAGKLTKEQLRLGRLVVESFRLLEK